MAAFSPLKLRGHSARKVPPLDRKNRRSPVKRHRTPAEDDPEPTTKHFMTEEKMAIRLGQLSISNDHSYTRQDGFHPLAKPNFASFHELERRLNDSSDEESDEETGPTSKEVTVEITPELKNYLKREQSVLPDSITKKLNKPCTAVMLWSPPPIVIDGEVNSVWKGGGSSVAKEDEDSCSSENNVASVEMDSDDSGQGVREQFPRNGIDMFAGRNGVRTVGQDDIEVLSQGIDISEDDGVQIDDIDSIPDGVVSHDSAVHLASRSPHNNAWRIPRNLMMAASQLVDNNNDPGAVDIEGMNNHLQRRVPGMLPQFRNGQVVGLGANVAFDNMDDDIDL